METSKIYLTLLVYVRQGEEELFQQYEDQVLPLLPKFQGELLYRLRPPASSFIYPSSDHPYEIHLLSFNSSLDFENYRQDKERLSYSPLFQRAVEKVILWQGQPL